MGNKKKQPVIDKIPDSKKFMILQQWMTSNGSLINKIELKYFKENVRAVYAKEDIKKDDELLFVPRSLLLRFDHIKDTQQGKIIQDEFKNEEITTSVRSM